MRRNAFSMIRSQTSVPNWSRPLRWIHVLLGLTVTGQLFVGSFMRSPHLGQADSLGFTTHEVLGGIILALVAAHWIWSYKHPNEGLHHLFPWTRAGMRRVLADVRVAVRQRRLPPGGPNCGGGASGFIHGLGLAAVTAVVLVGGVFFVARLGGAGQGSLGYIEDVHDVLAVIVWVYWGGHLAATIMHSLFRQPVWQHMFDLGK